MRARVNFFNKSRDDPPANRARKSDNYKMMRPLTARDKDTLRSPFLSIFWLVLALNTADRWLMPYKKMGNVQVIFKIIIEGK